MVFPELAPITPITLVDPPASTSIVDLVDIRSNGKLATAPRFLLNKSLESRKGTTGEVYEVALRTFNGLARFYEFAGKSSF